MSAKDKRWLRISLTLEEKRALLESALSHKRTPKQQAEVYVLAGLAQDGKSVHCKCPHCGGQVGMTQGVRDEEL